MFNVLKLNFYYKLFIGHYYSANTVHNSVGTNGEKEVYFRFIKFAARNICQAALLDVLMRFY